MKLTELLGFSGGSSNTPQVESGGQVLNEGNAMTTDQVLQMFPDLVDVAQTVDMDGFNVFRDMSEERVKQYQAFQDMTKDVVISAAIEMYADDASQYDNKGRILWAEIDSDEESTKSGFDLNKYIEELIEDLGLEGMMWIMYYSLALYGDVYIQLFKESSDDIKEEGVNKDVEFTYKRFVEISDEPENLFDLTKHGKTVQYARVKGNQSESSKYAVGTKNRDGIQLLPPSQFVHIALERPDVRDKELFTFKTTDKESRKTTEHVYKVRRGKSILHDIYAVEKEIQLLESSLILNRLSKSAMTRMVGVEVGDMSKKDSTSLLRRIKSSLENKISINENSMKTYSSPGKLDNTIVYPTREGKGSIRQETIGGDVDIKSLMDLDYFNDKRFGGLKIPKAFLGFDDAIASGSTLTKMDARYGRSVKRLQTSVIDGLTNLINFFLISDGHKDHVNAFTLRTVSPTTVDDLDRDEMDMNKLTAAGSVLQLMMGIEGVDQKEVLKYVIKEYLDDEELLKVVDNTKSTGNKADPNAVNKVMDKINHRQSPTKDIEPPKEDKEEKDEKDDEKDKEKVPSGGDSKDGDE